MTTLTVIAEQLLAPVPGGIGRYTASLLPELIAAAPAGWQVEALVARHPEAAIAELEQRFPGLAGTRALPLPPRLMPELWRRGIPGTMPGGHVHATSSLAPLSHRSHTVVSLHDAVPWTHPETLTAHGAAWHRAMGERAARFADGVAVLTQAVADQLAEVADFGDRLHVVPPAVSPSLVLPSFADERAAALGLPDEYILTVGTLEPRKALGALIEAMASPAAPPLPLVVVGPPGWGGVSVADAAARAGLAPDRVLPLGFLPDTDLAVAYDRATVFAFPSLAEGFGLPVLEAFSFGTPVVVSDDPALVEVSAGNALVVERAPAASYPERLAAGIRSLVDGPSDSADAIGARRARAAEFTWSRTAAAVWQLHLPH
ncbi:glycosyltransferase family 1 protein [Gryllotalpicola kribbensis]|uniref:Glycosyltransferase family 1 protein n=1 Tax=Gryllotalpicola kribbensis TaxID=993084 RepID=A0ABP8AQ76_9MICO